jgi:phage shock protein A
MMHEAADSALASLRAELTELESEIVAIERRLSDVRAQQHTIEVRAIEAIYAGDDLAARSALWDATPHAEAAASLEADLKVARAMADACRWFLDSHR